jgi:Protein of unknown function (DUF3667)
MRNRVKSDICPNCDANLTQWEDNFCGNCGQENHTYKLPLSYFVRELIETFTNFDAKTIATLRDLLLSPGLLTKNFNDNKRARYVPPVRLYLVTSAVFFFFFNFTYKSDVVQQSNQIKKEIMQGNGKGQIALFTTTRFTGEQFNQFMAMDKPNVAQIDSFCHFANIQTDFFNSRILKGMIDFRNGSLNVEMVQQKMLENFSYALFLCMPLFAILLYFFQSRKDYYFSEHLVFTLHFHTLLFIVFGLTVLITKWLISFNNLWAFTIILFALAKSMHVVYQQKWLISIFKTLIISVIYGFLLFGSVMFSLVGAFL